MLRTSQHLTSPLVEQRFQNELHELRRSRATLPIDTVRFATPLRFLYLRLTANDTSLTLALRTADTILVDYFIDLLGENTAILRQLLPTTTLLEYCNRDNIELEALQRFAALLPQLAFNSLQWKQLRALTTDRWLVAIAVLERPAILADSLAVERLLMILAGLPQLPNNENLADDLEIFLLHFPTQFAPLIVNKTEVEIQTRLSLWFMHWFNFYNHTEAGVALEDAYYQLPYWQIIRNVPNYFWWNNGVNLFGECRYFYLGSPEFRALAVGKSIRKLTNIAPFTRRMAKAFNEIYASANGGENLPTERQYFLLFARSLGADWQLATLLTFYLQRVAKGMALQAELDRWQPLIQKMTTFKSERWQNDEQLRRMFLGYVAHCLRDQGGLEVKRRSEQELLQAMDRYYARIEQRLAMRMAREKERQAAVPRIVSWRKHGSIQPLISIHFGQKWASKLTGRVQIVQLLNEHQLQQEGQQMRHCVGDYVARCRNRQTSIWSLRELNCKQWISRVTIEVMRSNLVVQARGRYNATPTRPYQEVVKIWMAREGLEFLEGSSF